MKKKTLKNSVLFGIIIAMLFSCALTFGVHDKAYAASNVKVMSVKAKKATKSGVKGYSLYVRFNKKGGKAYGAWNNKNAPNDNYFQLAEESPEKIQRIFIAAPSKTRTLYVKTLSQKKPKGVKLKAR